MNIKAEQFADICQGEWVCGTPLSVEAFAFDTRLICEGEVFVALKTAQRDGHDFAQVAVDKGAAALLVERKLDLDIPQLVVKDSLRAFQLLATENRRQFRGQLVAITGSCGKTSTKDILGRMLGAAALLTKGNLNNHIGVPLTLLSLDNDKHEFAVVEAGINHPGEMEVLAQMIQPDISIITNVSEAHTEGLKDLETVAREKAVLANHCSVEGKIVFPESCLAFDSFRHLKSPTSVLSFAEGLGELPLGYEICIVRVKDIRNAVKACRISIRQPACVGVDFDLGFLSVGQQQNVALAIRVALFLGIEHSVIQASLDQRHSSALRGEIKELKNFFFYVDCYNANPASMVDSFEAFKRRFSGMQKLCVLGCMNELGELSDELHRRTVEMMGIDNSIERIFIIGDQSKVFSEAFVKAGLMESKVTIVKDLEQVVSLLQSLAEPLAIFLKGSRSYRLERVLELLDEKGVAC